MDNYVNLDTLQNLLEDCLFSVRFIKGDHQDTPVTDEDKNNLDLKLKYIHHEITSRFPELLSENTSSIDYLPNLYEANHIKQTRDKIFIKAVNVFLEYAKKENKSFNEEMLNACTTIANDSIKKLYQVEL